MLVIIVVIVAPYTAEGFNHMIYYFTNKKRSSYIFLGMLFLSSLATFQASTLVRKKQTCTKEIRPSFLADLGCYMCKEIEGEKFKLFCCKKALCKTCSRTIVFNALSKTLNADENSEPKFACDVHCPASCNSIDAANCLIINDFHKVVDNDDKLKDLYKQAKELYETKNIKQNELKRDDFDFCNECSQTAVHYCFSNCDHTFCIACFEKKVIDNLDSWILEVADGKELTVENLIKILKKSQETHYFNFVYSKEKAFFPCSNAECQGGIANEYQVKYLSDQSKAILEINKKLIEDQIAFFDSQDLDDLFEKINESFDNALDHSNFKNSIPELKTQLKKDLDSLNYKLSLLNIYEQN